MESKMQNTILNSYDEDLLMAIVSGAETPIDWKEVILNNFFFQKTVIWYQYLNSSVRNLVAANFLSQDERDFKVNEALAKEIRAIQRGRHANYTSREQLIQQYPIDQAKLDALPTEIITEQEFEAAIERFYDFINRCMSNKLAPRMIAEDMLLIEGTSTDPTYGLTEENPINVGGFAMVGTSYINLYFNSLLGETGNTITYNRIASCRQIETPNGRNGRGFIDLYSVQIEGEENPIKIYINMYDCRLPLKAPMGFVGKVLG